MMNVPYAVVVGIIARDINVFFRLLQSYLHFCTETSFVPEDKCVLTQSIS